MTQKGWKYLDTEPFQVRQVIAAHFVRECTDIIEFGAGNNPILNYLAGPHEVVYLIDPLYHNVDETYHKRGGRLISRKVHWIRSDVKSVPISVEGGYGVVALGFDFEGEDLKRFLAFVDQSKMAVLECWKDYSRWKLLKQRIPSMRKEVVVRMDIDLSGNDVGDMTGSFPPRFNRELLFLR